MRGLFLWVVNMKILKLTQAFYVENNHLKEALDLTSEGWIRGKERGYGIAVVTVNNLRFGMLLRSNFTQRKQNSSFATVKGKNRCLDYSNVVLLCKYYCISYVVFEIPRQ